MKKIIILLIAFIFYSTSFAQDIASKTAKIEALETQKAAAIAKEDYALAKTLKNQIAAIKNGTTKIAEASKKDEKEAKIASLEQQKQEAINNQDYAKAKSLKLQIEALKNPSDPGSKNAEKIAELEKKKQEAVKNQNYALAKSLKLQIEALKNPSDAAVKNAAKIANLEEQKALAVKNKDYLLAKKFKQQIDALKNPSEAAQRNAEKIAALEIQKADAVKNKNYPLAKSLKLEIDRLKTPLSALKEKGYSTNNREIAAQKMTHQDFASSNVSAVLQATNVQSPSKIKNASDNKTAETLKYRRSSLYTLMINDESRLHAAVIKDAFGNSAIPTKFNDHNIGPYLINTRAGLKDQTAVINSYINTNNIAKSVVAKWFNRDKDGAFDMKLIAARGMFDATAKDKALASSSARGDAMLADAGEELIKNTFVIVNDYKFTNKEEVAKTAQGAIKAGRFFAKMAGVGDVADLALQGAETAVGVAGKGYIIKSTSYLFKLVWNEETEAIFYNNYWVDTENMDAAKVTAFNNSTDFQLQLIGSQVAWADVQSSIFTNKSEEDLIRIATVKATDKAIAKLEKKYESFRTKTPLYSGDPITAKIGTKEGLQGGDRFEVLEQILNPETKKITYRRVGIIRVDGNNIWDNTLTEEERAQLKSQGQLPDREYSRFLGAGKYLPGQLIRQIN